MRSIYLSQQVITQVFLMIDDHREVVNEALSQLHVNLTRRRRYVKEQLIVREDALSFHTAIVFHTRTTPWQLPATYAQPATLLSYA